MERLRSVAVAHRGTVAAAAIAVAAVGAVAWAVSSGPLVPASPAAGSGAGSQAVIHAPAAAGSSLPAAPGGAPDGADGAEVDAGRREGGEQQGAGAPSPADGGADRGDGGAGEPGEPSGGRGSEPKPQHQASAPDPGKPGKPAPQKPSPAPAPEPERPTRPAHSHSWVAVYRDEPVYGQQWVSKWEDVFVKRQGCFTCNGCGRQFPTVDAFIAHSDAALDAGDWGHGGYTDDSYDVWEKRDNGSYQTVQTGTKKVLDHYECACGARK